MDELINRVEQSGLVQLDLSRLAAAIPQADLDLAPVLWQGLALREKDYRAWLKQLDLASFDGCAVALHCSADATIPAWAWMLATNALSPVAHSVHGCAPQDVDGPLLLSIVDKLDIEIYRDARVVVKGCGSHTGPAPLMRLIERLRPVVKSLMFGEPCSTVPIYKRPRS
jgi:hypothetical protein